MCPAKNYSFQAIAEIQNSVLFRSRLARNTEAPNGGEKKGLLRNFAKFTGKHLYRRLVFNNVANLGFY